MDNHNKQEKSKNKYVLMLVSLFFSFTCIVYAPLEIYLTNRDEFWFRLSQFWFVVALLGMVAWALMVLVGMILPLVLQKAYIGAIFGASVMLYLQSNFLNADVGVMNGGSIDWAVYKVPFLLNLVLWGIVVIACMVLYLGKSKIVKKAVKYISVYITLIQAVTLCVLLFTGNAGTNNDISTKYLSDKGIYEVSEEENIIVFVMDMFDDRYFKELLVQEPELAGEFEGFTQYTNSTGNYSTTTYSIATLLTGQYLKNSKESLYEELCVLYEDCDTFELLAENDYRLDVYTYEGVIPGGLKMCISNYIDGSYEISDYPLLTKYLYKLVAVRYLPNIVKARVWMVGTEFEPLKMVDGDEDPQSVDNLLFYDKLKNEGISTLEGQKCFKFIHLDGTHYPYVMNENAEPVSGEEVSAVQCARGVVKILLDYMDGMKKAGVYENSSIIITADHGYYWNGTLTNPVLLVKPKGAHGALQESNAPVSQHDFHPSILSFAGLNDNGEYGKSYFDILENEERERLFYQYYLDEESYNSKFRLIEYTIDSEGNERKHFHLTGVEYTRDGEVVDHFASCEYCKSGEAEPNDNEARIIHR